MFRQDGYIRVLLLCILLISFGLHLTQLNERGVWQDEGLSLFHARQNLPGLLAGHIPVEGVTTYDPHPPLYFLLLNLFVRLVGLSEFSARYISVAFASLLICALYVAGRRLQGPTTGLLAGLLGGISPLYLWYAQEIRMYVQLAFLALVSSYALWRVLEQKARSFDRTSSSGRFWGEGKRWLALYLVTTAAMLYTHYSAFFILVFQGLTWGIFLLRRHPLWSLATTMIVGLAGLPLLPFAWHRLQTGAERGYHFIPLWMIIRDIWNGFSMGLSVRYADVFWIDILFAVLVFAGMVGLLRQSPWKKASALFLLGWLAIPVTVLWGLSHVKPMYQGVRHLFLISPAYYLLVATGLSVLKRRALPLYVVSLALVLGGAAYSTGNYFSNPRYQKDDLRGMFTYVRENFRPGDIVVLSDAVHSHVLTYYAPELPWMALPHYPRRAGPDTEKELQSLQHRYQRVWFVYGPPGDDRDPKKLVKRWFDNHTFKLDDRLFHGKDNVVGVAYYATRSPITETLPPIEHPFQTDIAGGLRFRGYDFTGQDPVLGRRLFFNFYWQVYAQPDADLAIFVRLEDERGQIWGSGNEIPFHGLHPTSHWLPGQIVRVPVKVTLFPGTPPAQYRLRLGLYRQKTGTVLDVLENTGNRKGQSVDAGSFAIPASLSPSRGNLGLAHHSAVRFGDKIVLTGYGFSPPRARAGEAVTLRLGFRILRRPDQEVTLRWQLLGPAGRVWEEKTPSLLGVNTSNTNWPAGNLFLAQHRLMMPPNASPGRYAVRLSALDAQGHPLPTSEFWGLKRGHAVTVGPLVLEERHRNFTLPPLTHPLSATLGSQIELVGFDLQCPSPRQLPCALAPGEQLRLTLVWRAKGPTGRRYKVFTHLVGPDGKLWGQYDAEPAGGDAPTTTWVPGEVISDTHTISLDPQAPTGTYRLLVGMYHEASGQRLPASLNGKLVKDDALPIAKFKVKSK